MCIRDSGQLDDSLSHRGTLARDDLQHPVGHPGVVQDLGTEEGRERGLRVGAQDNRVAGEQGRDGVTDRQGEGVVPRADDADHAIGLAHRLGLGEQWVGPPDAFGRQVGGPRATVVARDQGDVGDLLEGLQAGLARLQLHEVQELDLPVQDKVVDAQDDRGPLRDRQPRPGPLGAARVVDGHLHVGPGRQRQLVQDGSGQRGDAGSHLGSRPGHQTTGERGDEPVSYTHLDVYKRQALHVAIAEAAGNRLAADFTVAIRESMRVPLLDAFRYVPDWEDLVDTLRADHAALYAAIEAGDADRAEQLVEDHIRSAWSRLAPGFVEKPAERHTGGSAPATD